MRILLVGYGKMGRLVGELTPQYGGEVAGIVDPMSPSHAAPLDDPRWAGVDVAIDFTSPEAVLSNVTTLAAQRINIVLGTTGWGAHEAELRDVVAAAGVGIVAAPNFSTGVVLFEALVARAAQSFATHPEFGAWIHEAHHAAKKDAPSGTALKLRAAMAQAGYDRPIDVSATRAGYIPGTHTIGFDGPSESITLTHAARDRGGFARGALTAAQWVRGRSGWFTMQDVLGIANR
ncbi:MAG TPA: dihydrodipicolinate reductase C-terminal domain-containing protein [Vicinamibacterales bacterium]|nr:dihydrodipicolinate reductase C-terminal domain-containing protein [Vicinamibacterales bacterium]